MILLLFGSLGGKFLLFSCMRIGQICFKTVRFLGIWYMSVAIVALATGKI